jgi:hypothetical protein
MNRGCPKVRFLVLGPDRPRRFNATASEAVLILSVYLDARASAKVAYEATGIILSN